MPTLGVDPGPCQACGRQTVDYCGACYDWLCSDECAAKHLAEQHDEGDPAARHVVARKERPPHG